MPHDHDCALIDISNGGFDSIGLEMSWSVDGGL